MTEYNLENLFYDLLKKRNIDKEISYTSTLLTNKNMLAKKIGEESVEVLITNLIDKGIPTNPEGNPFAKS